MKKNIKELVCSGLLYLDNYFNQRNIYFSLEYLNINGDIPNIFKKIKWYKEQKNNFQNELIHSSINHFENDADFFIEQINNILYNLGSNKLELKKWKWNLQKSFNDNIDDFIIWCDDISKIFRSELKKWKTLFSNIWIEYKNYINLIESKNIN